MTAPTVDVNEGFYTQRLRQIADAKDAPRRAAEAEKARYESRKQWFDERLANGKLQNLGGGRYRVNEPGTFDNGEILYLRQFNVNGVERQVILPEHGLANAVDGKIALYVRSGVPIWHELGQVIEGGTSNIDVMLRAGGLDWPVEKFPDMQLNPNTGLMEQVPGKFVIHRMDTGSPLGVVGRGYTPFTNREGAEFLQNLVDKYDVVFESAGELEGGSRVFICMRLPQDVRIDRGGINDEILPFVVCILYHDGQGKIKFLITPWRPLCGNTERLARRDMLAEWGTAHTKNAKERVKAAQISFARSISYFEKFVHEENQLAEQVFTDAAFEALVKDMFFANHDEELAAGMLKPTTLTKRTDHMNKMNLLWQVNAAELGPTAYAAERAMTEWATWHRGMKTRKDDPLYGQTAALRAASALEKDSPQRDVRSVAHNKLMILTNEDVNVRNFAAALARS